MAVYNGSWGGAIISNIRKLYRIEVYLLFVQLGQIKVVAGGKFKEKPPG
jgi:hypothetical protein